MRGGKYSVEGELNNLIPLSSERGPAHLWFTDYLESPLQLNAVFGHCVEETGLSVGHGDGDWSPDLLTPKIAW